MQTKNSCQAPTDLATFIQSDGFPCVGAKSAMSLGGLRTFEAGAITSAGHDSAIYAAVADFERKTRSEKVGISSFVCLFQRERLSEERFEEALWQRLQALHDEDIERGLQWAKGVSSDSSSPAFSMSVGGVAYFIVGMHPGASRAARKFCRPALVFNLHEQFHRLRRDGRYVAMQKIVRGRDINQNGSVNPMLTDFGQRSEAAQYSGRQVSADWVCPLELRA